MKTRTCFAFVILAILISSCGNISKDNVSKDASFQALYPACTMNSMIRFLPFQKNREIGDNIYLDYKNYLQDSVIFPPDSNVKMLTYNEQELRWIEIENNMQYGSSVSEPYVISGPSNELSSYGTIGISPIFPNNPPKEIRVVVSGNVYRNNVKTNECVGAFIDIQP